MMRTKSCVAAILVLSVLASLAPAGETLLQKGDRVVFYGDSITQQRMYTRYLMQYLLCRYPDLDLTFYNAGWSGDTAGGALRRLDRDVLVLKPTVVSLFFGMNDGRYREAGEQVDVYRKNMDELIGKLKDAGARVIVFTPGCVDTDRRPNLAKAKYNDTLEKLAEVALDLAKKHDCPSVDVFHPMIEFQAKQKAKAPKFTMIPDSIHPNDTGHEVMANLMLKGFGAQPMPNLAIVDLSKNTAEGVEIVSKDPASLVLRTKGSVPIPYWYDAKLEPYMQDCGLADFAGQKLQIVGLPKGAYDVTTSASGGKVLGQYTAEQLAKGVSLPASADADAKALHDWAQRKENTYFETWRNIRLNKGLAEPEKSELYEAYMGVDAVHAKLLRQIAQPRETIDITIGRSATGINVSRGKPYTCSDPNQYDWGIGCLTDGSWRENSNGCFASGDKAEFPKWVTIDLQKAQTISAVKLGVPGFGSTKTIAVSASEDGKTFTDLGTHEFAEAKSARHTYRFDPVEARYVRLTYPDHYKAEHGYSPNFAFTVEAEVYAEAE